MKVYQANSRVQMYVVPDNAQTIALLIRQPFTEQPHVTIMRRENTRRVFEEHGNFDKDDEQFLCF